MNSNTAFAFLLTFFAGFSTMLGTIPIFFQKKDENKMISAALSFAAGVMMTVSLTDLIPESLTSLKTTFQTPPTYLLMGTFVVIGIIFSMMIDHFFPDQPKKGSEKKLYRIGLISMIAIILHNIPEGIATFMATTSNTKLGITLAIAIALHNIPEGISISIPLYYATKKRKRALGYTFLSGISEPFGALLAYLFLSPFLSDTLMGCLFAIIAGIMLHIAIYELLPAALQYKEKKTITIFFSIGVIFMLINHFFF